MDLETLIAQWSGKAPPGFIPHGVLMPPFPPGRAAVRDRASRFPQPQQTG